MAKSFSIEVAKDYFNFASAHFLIFANGQREALHGHNYQVSCYGRRARSCRRGARLISFKPVVKRICDALHHRTLIQTGSPAIDVRKRAHEVEVRYKKQKIILPRQDVILLPLANTSTELLAEHVAIRSGKKSGENFLKTKIRHLKVGVEEARGERGFYRGEF